MNTGEHVLLGPDTISGLFSKNMQQTLGAELRWQPCEWKKQMVRECKDWPCRRSLYEGWGGSYRRSAGEQVAGVLDAAVLPPPALSSASQSPVPWLLWALADKKSQLSPFFGKLTLAEKEPSAREVMCPTPMTEPLP